VQGDGDIIAHLDVAIEVVPAGLNLVFPPASPGAADLEAPQAAVVAAARDRIAAYTPPPGARRVAGAACLLPRCAGDRLRSLRNRAKPMRGGKNKQGW
jgi:hypothetical protein